MLTIQNLKVCHRVAPIGLDEIPSFSWILDSTNENVYQTAYHICVRKGSEVIWDSGRVESDQSVAISYDGPVLEALTTYQVTLTVWDNFGEQAEKYTVFESGMLGNRNFTARWITHTLPAGETACPVFFKEFIAKKMVKARLLSSACGVYEASINGKKVSTDLLAPGWTNYRKRIQYQTYYVTDLIEETNRIEITVAPGWYQGYLNCENKNCHYGDKVAAFAELHLWYADGTTEVIKTDESWFFTTGATQYAELYHGETINSGAVPVAPQGVIIYEAMDNSRLVSQQCEPVRITERLKPVALIHTPKGETVLDFGQNISGVVELRISGMPGQKITLRHAEVLDKEGNFYTENLRTARATDTFICKGGEEVFRPRFTFHGFRYVAVEGMDEVNPGDFTACAIHSDMEAAGTFSCSNELVNKLWSNISWSMRDNFVDIPTDCPQRDERLGWTGDAAVFASTAGQLRDTYLFFSKWLADLYSEQSREFGIPDTIPNILMPPGTPCGGSAVWGDSATIVPWSAYQLSGDKQILAQQYGSMKDWVEWIRRSETLDHLHKSGHQRGDWLAMDREEGIGNSGSTDRYLLSTVFYAHSTWILAQSAEILGYEADAKEYSELYEGIKEGFRAEYITANGRLVSETQTACALVLCMGLAKHEHEERIIQTLADNLAQHQNKLTTGFIGTPYLCQALSRFGRHDLAGKLLLNEEFPGWLNEVKLGATTIWERWDSKRSDGSFDESGMNSFNHYSFGAVGSWMIEQLAGIQLAKPGYKESILRPQFVQGLTEVSASRKTPYGPLSCGWKCKNRTITVDVTVPANTTATLWLPEKVDSISLGSGSYHYEYATDTRLEPLRYTMDTTIGKLAGNPLFLDEVEKLMPGASRNMHMEFLQKKTLGEMMAMMPSGTSYAFQGILNKLNEVEA